jgi:hypothetical protein
VAEGASEEEIEVWRSMKRKDYKIRLVGTFVDMNSKIPGLVWKWKFIDDTKVKFRGMTQPAEKYLFYYCCQQVLKRSWNYAADDHYFEKLWLVNWEYVSRYLIESLLVELDEAVGYEHLYDDTFGWEEGEKEKIMGTVVTMPLKKKGNTQRTDAQKTPVIRLKQKREAEAKEDKNDGVEDWYMLSEISFHK